MRAELTTDERREHLRKRKDVWERREEERKNNNGASRPTIARGPGRPKEFAQDTAEKTGMSKRQINRLLADPKPKPEPLTDEDVTVPRQALAAPAPGITKSQG